MGSPRRARRAAPASWSQRSGFTAGAVAGLLVVAGVLGGLWCWWHREDPVAETLELQRLVLDGSVSGRELRLTIDRISRNVDHMSGSEVQGVRDALAAGLESLRDRSIEDYFAARATDERRAILDRHLDRQAVLEELRSAVRNHSWGGGGRPRRRPGAAAANKPATEPTAAEKELAKARRELEKQYLSALQKRAAEKGIALATRR